MAKRKHKIGSNGCPKHKIAYYETKSHSKIPKVLSWVVKLVCYLLKRVNQKHIFDHSSDLAAYKGQTGKLRLVGRVLQLVRMTLSLVGRVLRQTWRVLRLVEIVLRLDARAMCTIWRVRRLAGNTPGLTGRVLRKVESSMRLVCGGS